MTFRPDPYLPSPAADRVEAVARAAPVNPGAWDTRSWTLVDPAGEPSGDPATPAPPGRESGSRDAARVVWPAAGEGDVPALDADGVPLAEPPTGPLPPLPAPAGTAAPGPPRGPWTFRRGAQAADAVPSARSPYPEHDEGPAPAGRGRLGPTAANGGDAGPRAGRGAPPVREGHALPPGRTAASGHARQGSPAPFADGGPAGARRETPGRPAAASGLPAGTGSPAVTGTPARDTAVPGGSADPVRELMRRHRPLCENAVDPLEIAAGLEAHGITDRTAARYRHRDVFSLAEELYVRVPRAEAAVPGSARDAAGAARAGGLLRGAGRGMSHLLPGVLCAATLAGLPYVPPAPLYARPAVGALGTLAVLAAVGLSLRGVPRTRTAGLWACWLLGYLLYGDWLLTHLLSGDARPARFLPAIGCLCVPLALGFGVAPAAWCAHLFAVRARRRLAVSRSLDDFASRVRPLLLLTVALFTVALLAVQGAAHVVVEGVAPPHATQAATAALGVLLFLALLLSAHGFPRAASAGLAGACLLVAAALGAVLASRLPGAHRLARPVEAAVAAHGPAVVPIAACALAALPLLAHALRVLTGASAHQRSATFSGRSPRRDR